MRKESHDFDGYLGLRYHLVRFEPILVDCCNEITCFSCVFVNTIVEMNLTASVCFLWSRDRLRRSGSRFRRLSELNYVLQLCFRQYDCRNEFDGFGRFPSVARSFASFWCPIQLIVIMELRVSVVF